MRLLSREQAQAWIDEDAAFDARGLPAIAKGSLGDDRARLVVPAQVEAWLAWARVDRATELLVWTYEWGIWPSNEDWALYARWRQALGDTRTIEETPACLCMAHDFHDACSLFGMALRFGWGVRAVCRDWGRSIDINHDTHVVVTARDAPTLATAPAGLLGP
jgi:hypothetical protein